MKPIEQFLAETSWMTPDQKDHARGLSAELGYISPQAALARLAGFAVWCAVENANLRAWVPSPTPSNGVRERRCETCFICKAPPLSPCTSIFNGTQLSWTHLQVDSP